MKRFDIIRKRFVDAAIDEKKPAVVEIQNMIAAGVLKIEQLDPKKTYVWTVGNLETGYYPSDDDIKSLRDLIQTIGSESQESVPHFIVHAATSTQEAP